ncbi:hypothetical protein BP6252_01464 [Coleophoma cylindrospora]|uniref:Cytochrome c domain-containing protein n=1 Tax=Coleophoma cylindrospora TaxID=1849047 RepID=A0A3D8ST10_9HELO|nr:hypothetical protein BP6252_01464 [Coleophoma cylindrospora]
MPFGMHAMRLARELGRASRRSATTALPHPDPDESEQKQAQRKADVHGHGDADMEMGMRLSAGQSPCVMLLLAGSRSDTSGGLGMLPPSWNVARIEAVASGPSILVLQMSRVHEFVHPLGHLHALDRQGTLVQVTVRRMDVSMLVGSGTTERTLIIGEKASIQQCSFCHSAVQAGCGLPTWSEIPWDGGMDGCLQDESIDGLQNGLPSPGPFDPASNPGEITRQQYLQDSHTFLALLTKRKGEEIMGKMKRTPPVT